jgi:hypothetical protein
MVPRVPKLMSMKTLLDKLYYQFLRVIMLLFWHMDRQVLVRLTLWKASNIARMILKEVLYPDLWKRYSDSFKMAPVNK